MDPETTRWADLSEEWARKEARAMAQRAANEEAAAAGLPLPFPNIWDQLDPTKIAREDDSPEAFARSVREFNQICRPLPRKRYVLSRTSPSSSKS